MPRPKFKRFADQFLEKKTNRQVGGKDVYRTIIRIAEFDIEVNKANPHLIPKIAQIERVSLITQKLYGFRKIPMNKLNRSGVLLTVDAAAFTFTELTPWMDMAVFISIAYTKTP